MDRWGKPGHDNKEVLRHMGPHMREDDGYGFGIVFQIANAAPSVAIPIPANNAVNVAPADCSIASSKLAPVMNAALSTFTPAMVRAR